MKSKLLKLKKQFKPYYEVWISEDYKRPIITKRAYSDKTLIKYRMSKGFISCRRMDFETFVKQTLNI